MMQLPGYTQLIEGYIQLMELPGDTQLITLTGDILLMELLGDTLGTFIKSFSHGSLIINAFK